jgi:hypothetical protein
MPVEKKIKTKSTEEKSVDLFLDRLVEILLKQVEQEALSQVSTTLSAEAISESSGTKNRLPPVVGR